MKTIRFISAAAAVFMSSSLLTGCTFGASIDNLLAPPKQSREQEQIYNALTEGTGSGIRLKYPRSGKYLSAFIIEDIDSDGTNEAVVFYERNGLGFDEHTLRINVLDQDDGKWRSVCDTAAAGTEIEKVMISKLGTNDQINLIIGSSLINRSEKNVTIYSYDMEDEKIVPTFSESYSFMDITDLDGDGTNDFLVLSGSVNNTKATAEVYKLDEAGKYHQYLCELSGSFTEFDNLSYGKLPDGKTGLYIDAVSGSGSIQTDVISMDESGIKKVFGASEISYSTIRPSGCSSFDIDRDGVLEIPVQVISPGYEDTSEVDQIKLTNWMSITSSGNLARKYSSYYSIGEGYVFVFPEKWHDKVTLKRDPINDEMVFCAYSDNTAGRELLRIYYAQDPVSREDRISAGYMLMHTKGDSAYLALIPQSGDNKDSLSLTSGDVAIGFNYIE